MEQRERAPILVGTCNWVDHEEFYPAELRGRRQKERLAFYARYFPLVEIDSSFYGIPTPAVVADWVARTPEGFRFNIKAYRSLTGHEREQGRPRPPTEEEERSFAEALTPLREAGRLGAVHYQFPPWFVSGPEACEALLRELDLTLVGVDAPQLGSGTAPPHLAVTSPRLVLVRFHGRNYQTWYRKVATTGERFDYLYPPQVLREWVPGIEAAADRGVPVHVLMNNNRSNYAVVNAFDMAHLLELGPPRPPEPILRRMAERDGEVPDWTRHAALPPPWEGSPNSAKDPVVAHSDQLRLDV